VPVTCAPCPQSASVVQWVCRFSAGPLRPSKAGVCGWCGAAPRRLPRSLRNCGCGPPACRPPAPHHPPRVIRALTVCMGCVFLYTCARRSRWGGTGTCVNVGCIPKKLMHHGAQLGEAIHDARQYGWALPEEKPAHNWEHLVSSVSACVKGASGASSSAVAGGWGLGRVRRGVWCLRPSPHGPPPHPAGARLHQGLQLVVQGGSTGAGSGMCMSTSVCMQGGWVGDVSLLSFAPPPLAPSGRGPCCLCLVVGACLSLPRPKAFGTSTPLERWWTPTRCGARTSLAR
jgi:hypothetical protein